METIKDKAVQIINNLQPSLPDTTNKAEVSKYGEGKVSSKVLADCIIELKKAFPKLPIGWYDVLQRHLVAEKFTDQRLIDATNNLIRTCVYPEPTVAQVLGYDKKEKLYTYQDLLEITKDYSPESRKKYWELFERTEDNLWRLK